MKRTQLMYLSLWWSGGGARERAGLDSVNTGCVPRDGSSRTEERERLIFHSIPFVTFVFVPCVSINYSKNKVKWEKNKSFWNEKKCRCTESHIRCLTINIQYFSSHQETLSHFSFLAHPGFIPFICAGVGFVSSLATPACPWPICALYPKHSISCG